MFVNPRLNSDFRAFCYKQESHLVDWALRRESEGRILAEKAMDMLACVGCSRGDLLDVGCGIGTFLTVARERGFGVTGIELNESAAHFAARQHHVLQGDFYDVPLPEESFDVVVLEQTLEHLGRPLAALVKARRLLRPGAYIYVDVPRVDWLRLLADRLLHGRALFGELWSPEDHLYYYTPRTMRRLLARAQFEPLSARNTRMKWEIRDRLGLSAGQFLGRKDA